MMNNFAKTDLHFAGHDTFPLRQLWLLKVHKYVCDCLKNNQAPNFSGEEAIVRFGVGKNMVSSMRFWATASQFLDPKTNTPTAIADLVFGRGSQAGLDPYAESTITPWLVHWNLASQPTQLTVFWYLFNMVNRSSISRHELQEALVELAQQNDRKVSASSIKRDVEVCIRSYVPLTAKGKGVAEDAVEPILGEVDLISCPNRDVVELRRSSRSALSNALFSYCVLDFWLRQPNQSSSMTLLRIAHDIGSPGRVFKIDENSIAQRLESIEDLSEGCLLWTEQAGIRAIIRKKAALTDPTAVMHKILSTAYQEE